MWSQGGAAVLVAPFLPKLVELDLRGQTLSADGVGAFAAALLRLQGRKLALRALNLSDCRLCYRELPGPQLVHCTNPLPPARRSLDAFFSPTPRPP